MIHPSRLTAPGESAGRFSCPVCSHYPFEFTVRCHLSLGSCVFTASCNGCGMYFDLVVPQDVLDVRDLRQSAGHCPRCGSVDRAATLWCTNHSGFCSYYVECKECGLDEVARN